MVKIKNNRIILGMLLSAVFGLSYCSHNLDDQDTYARVKISVENMITLVNAGYKFLSQLTGPIDIEDEK